MTARCGSTVNVATPELERGSSLVGTLLDQRYVVNELIGSGGMSCVYRAEHVLLGRHVAIKTLHASLSQDEDLVARVLREARVTAAIDSPYVIGTLDMGRLPSGGFYQVLELLEGCDLTTLVKHRGRLDVSHSLDIALQLCDAVAAVHRAGVIHRDIKPDNVFVTSSNPLSLKLLDFGICKVVRQLAQAHTTTATLPGVIMGTPDYMAPEQIEQRELAGPGIDLYAIGATLHFMLTGRPPFEAASLPRLLLQICEADLAPIDGPPQLMRVLERALAKRPQDRFLTVSALRKALSACAKQLRVREPTMVLA